MTGAPIAITLLTDFGTADGYVAEMKGVLLAQAPHVQLVDASHDIPPHDIEAARLALARYWRRFPPGSIHVVVVDPGVGGDRAAISIASSGHFFVGPDNGVLSSALFAPDARAVTLPIPNDASATFHGRDVFAPAAALLAQGAYLEDLGESWPSPVRLRTPEVVRITTDTVAGQVLTIDRFGNALTNLVGRAGRIVRVGGQRIPLLRTYADALPGEVCAVIGSNGFVEIAVRGGSAANVLQLERGDEVRLSQAQ